MYEELRGASKPLDSTQQELSFLETQLMKSEEFTALVDYIVQIVPGTRRENITPRTHLEIDLGLDSLKSLDLVSMIEEQFECEVPPEVLLKLETVGDAASAARDLRGKGKGKNAPLGRGKKTATQHSPETDDSGHVPESKSLVFRTGAPLVKSLSTALWGLQVENRDRARTSSPVIFAANHESLLDIVWLLAALPWDVRKKTYSVGKAELSSSPALRFIVRRTNMIPVEREGDFSQALQTARTKLLSGKNLVFFPEGTRSRTGEMGAFKSGIGSLVIDTNATVVPVRIKGSFEIWTPGKPVHLLAGHAHKPRLIFGEPVTLQSLTSVKKLPSKPKPEQVAEALRNIIVSM